MQTRLWIIFVVVVAWIGFLIGYSVSALTGVKPPAAEVKGAGGYAGAAEESKPGAGGYGAAEGKPKAGAGGYSGGAERPKTGGARPKAGAGGYGGKD